MPSDAPETPDLAMVGVLLQRLITEVATLRDDMNVTAAILHRLDNGQERLLAEVRAMHAQHSRFGNRLRTLEERAASE